MFSYTERIPYTNNPTAQTLFRLMDEKQTNLCFAADVTTKSELLLLADILGPEICVFKTHIDIIEDFDNDLVIRLQRLAEYHRFLIFEDRKFADIGNTVKFQYQDGIYHIADWAHIVNAHTVPGPGIIEGLKEIGFQKGRGLLLLAEMSSEGTLAKDTYTADSIAMAEANTDFVIGFITTKKLTEYPGFIHFTPGVQRENIGDTLGQQYLTPETVIGERGSDIIIVGRGIYTAPDPVREAHSYRLLGWRIYQQKTPMR